MKKVDKIILIAILGTLSLLLTGCNNNTSILQQANSIVINSPDSALIILSRIEDPYQLENKEKADYWRIRSEAHYRKSHAMITDSLILFSLKYYQEVNDTIKMLDAYLLTGEYYKWKRESDSVSYILNQGLSQAISIKDSVYISKLLYKLGTNELDRNKKRDAIEYFKERIKFDKNAYDSYYLVGLFSNNDSTQNYLDKGVELALEKGDTLSAAHFLRNNADIYVNNKNYNKAIELIKKTGELSDFYKDFGFNYHTLTYIYIVTGKIDSAQYYLDKAKNEKRKSSFGNYTDKNLITTKNGLYILQAVIDAKNNKEINIAPMYRFNDSIITETIRKDRVLLEQINERNSLEQKNLQLLINKRNNQILLIGIFTFIILASIATYLYNLKKKRKLEEIEERSESLQRLFKEALNVKDEKEKNTHLFRKTLLQQLGIIRLIATSPIKQNQNLLRQIVDISKETVSTESLINWRDLYSIIDSIYNNFHNKLIQVFGEKLNEKEIQLCCLLCADFSTSEISAVMQQSMQTIYQRKTSIRQKINMDEKEDIVLFLKEQIGA